MPADIQEKAPGVYVRDEQELPRELDLLWSNSRSYHREDRSSFIAFIIGLIVGAALTSAVFLLLVMRPNVQTGGGVITAPISDSVEKSSPGTANSSKAAPSATSKATGSTYTVTSGDTLGSISQKVYGSVDPKYLDKIRRANNLSNPNSLQLNQTLIIPPKEY